MTTVMDMALEAGGVGINDYYTNGRVTAFSSEQLEAFAELVRADEREACAKVCDELQSPPDWNLVAVLWKECRSKLAAAIRARGNTCTPPIAADPEAFHGFPSGLVSAPNAGGKCVTAGETAPVKEIDPNQWAFDRGLESS